MAAVVGSGGGVAGRGGRRLPGAALTVVDVLVTMQDNFQQCFDLWVPVVGSSCYAC